MTLPLAADRLANLLAPFRAGVRFRERQQGDGRYPPIVKTFGSFIFFPHASMVLTAPNPVMARLPETGLPSFLYKRRNELGLSKREVARRLGVHCEVIGLWERGERHPRVSHIPAIVDFLGDASWLSSATFAARLYRFRALKGWTQDQFAIWLGQEVRNIRRWEKGYYPEVTVGQAIDCYLVEAQRGSQSSV